MRMGSVALVVALTVKVWIVVHDPPCLVDHVTIWRSHLETAAVHLSPKDVDALLRHVSEEFSHLEQVPACAGRLGRFPIT